MTTAKPKQDRKKRRQKSRIPVFKSIEEEAEFWDTHSTTEFEDEWEDVTGQVRFIVTRGGPKKRLTVLIDVDTLAELRELARSLEVRPATLVRLWVYEGLHKERARAKAKR